MNTERLLKSKEITILKAETSLSIQRTAISDNNGILSMSINGRVSQPRDNSIRDSDSMSREISMLSQNCHNIDTLT
jgi:hypothetical protein